MKVTAGIIAVVVVLFAGSCAISESSTPPLPAYTPTPADLYKAYSTALDDLDAAAADLHKARSTALGKLEAAPEVALNAVQEARDCDVPIDALTNDPRDILTAIGGIPGDPQLRAARGAPRSVAHDLAAAHVASPANRAAVEAALSANFGAHFRDQPTPDDPVFAVYLDYLDDDPAFHAYLAALDGINAAYFPVSDNLSAARSDLVQGLILASNFRDCTSSLFVLYEAYMAAYEAHRPALFAYFDGIRVAIENYADALELARASYGQR